MSERIPNRYPEGYEHLGNFEDHVHYPIKDLNVNPQHELFPPESDFPTYDMYELFGGEPPPPTMKTWVGLPRVLALTGYTAGLTLLLFAGKYVSIYLNKIYSEKRKKEKKISNKQMLVRIKEIDKNKSIRNIAKLISNVSYTEFSAHIRGLANIDVAEDFIKNHGGWGYYAYLPKMNNEILGAVFWNFNQDSKGCGIFPIVINNEYNNEEGIDKGLLSHCMKAIILELSAISLDLNSAYLFSWIDCDDVKKTSLFLESGFLVEDTFYTILFPQKADWVLPHDVSLISEKSEVTCRLMDKKDILMCCALMERVVGYHSEKLISSSIINNKKFLKNEKYRKLLERIQSTKNVESKDDFCSIYTPFVLLLDDEIVAFTTGMHEDGFTIALNENSAILLSHNVSLQFISKNGDDSKKIDENYGGKLNYFKSMFRRGNKEELSLLDRKQLIGAAEELDELFECPKLNISSKNSKFINFLTANGCHMSHNVQLFRKGNYENPKGVYCPSLI